MQDQLLRIFRLFLFTAALSCNIAIGAPFTVTTNSGGTGAGSLYAAINNVNTTGDVGASANTNTITIGSGLGTITLSQDLPVIQRGVTITGPVGIQTISGANAFRLFATSKVDLTLQNLTLNNGLALGGTGGGGGLGAGGGVYIDLGRTLTLSNTSISGCKAQGGPGGTGTNFNFGGGGPSFAVSSSRNGTATSGGGDNAGNINGTGGSSSQGVTGYGGGAGGFGFPNPTAVAGGGVSSVLTAGQAADVFQATGGSGGYCGGGGGGGAVTVGVSVNNNGGGGGGNGGGAGGNNGTATIGAGGGGFAGGGAGAFPGVAGGGGFGAGGGNTGVGGGGGGGFGGGGGGGTTVSLTSGVGGAYAGTGGGDNTGSNFTGGGGGGAGIGSGIFVGDTSTLVIGDGISISGNVAPTGGAGGAGRPPTGVAGAAGSGYAADIFLFQKASITFNGSSNLSVPFAIQGDVTYATAAANKDSGVNINTSGGAVITFSSGSNNYQGGTTLTSGSLSIAADNALGTAPSSAATNITFNGGTLITTASISPLSANRTIAFTGSGTFQPAVATTLTIGATGQLTGSGALTMSGAGTLAISNANAAYTGNKSISAGTVQIGNVTSLGTGGTLTMSGGGALQSSASLGNVAYNYTLTGAATFKGANNFTMSGTGSLGNNTLTIANTANTITLSGGITDGGAGSPGSITQNGVGGTLVLSGTNTYFGATTITAGTLNANAVNTLSPNSAVSLANSASASLNLQNNNQIIGSLSGGGASGGNISLGSGVLTIHQTALGTYAGALSGSGGITLSSSSDNTLTLSNANASYSGTTTVTGGTLAIGTTTSLGTNAGAAALTMNGGSLQASTALGAVATKFTLTASSTFNGTNSFTMSGAGVLGNNTLNITNTAGTITLSGGLTDTSTGAITQNGVGGTLVLSGTNTYHGTTTVTAGTFSAGAVNAFSPNSALSIADSASASVNLQNNNQIIGPLSGGGASGGNISLGSGVLTIHQTALGTYAGALSGSGGITLSSSSNNTLTLSNANASYSGTTTVTGGTLAIGTTTSLGTNAGAAALTMNGGSLQASTALGAVATKFTLTASSTFNGTNSFTMNGAGVLGNNTLNITNTAGTITLSGGLSDTLTGAITQNGIGGTLELSGTNTYHGATTVTAGTLNAGANNAMSANSALVLANSANASFNLQGFNQVIGTLSGGGTSGGHISLGAGTLTINQTALGTYAGNISGTGGALALSGSSTNTLTLSGTNTYTGGTSIAAGTLAANGVNLPSTGTVTLTGGTLNFTGGTFPSVILNNTAGIVNISGTCAPSTTSTNTGTLNINASGGSFTVPATFTSVGGTITVASGGTPGILNVDNPLSGIVTNAGTTNVAAAFTPASTSTNSGTMNINNGGTFTQPSPTFTYSGTINVNTTNTTPFGALVGDNSTAILRFGNTNSVPALTLATTINQVPNIQVGTIANPGTSVTFNGAVTNINSTFSVTSGSSATLGAAFSGTAAGTNNGSLTVNNTFGITSLTNTGTLVFSGGSTNNSTPIVNNGTFNITGNSLNSALLTNNSLMSIVSATLSSGTILNNVGATLTFNGATNNDAITNHGTINVTGNSTNNAAIANDGTITISPSVAVSGGATITNATNGLITLQNASTLNNAITNSGGTLNVTGAATSGAVSGTGAVTLGTSGVLSATSFANTTGAATLSLNIVNHSTFGHIISSGAANLDGAVITVTSTATQSDSWDIVTGSSVSLVGTTFNLPSTAGLFSTWSHSSTPTAIVVSIVFEPILNILTDANTYALEVGAALDAMAAGTTSTAQQQLLSYFYESDSVAELIYSLNQMVANVSTNTANTKLQNTMLQKVEMRANAVHQVRNSSGFVAGDINPNVSCWLAGLGDIAKQEQSASGLNTGYRIRASGGLLGIDTNQYNDMVIGLALGMTNANIYEMSHNNYTTRTLSYYALLYGSMFKKSSFFEWAMVGSTNKNTGVRPMNVAGNSLSGNSSYRSLLAGIKFNLGNYRDLNDFLRYSYLFSTQYSLLHQPEYSESGSVAALNVISPLNQNTLTFGTGIRLALAEDPWTNGLNELHALVTYDVINPSQATAMNFVVGSPNFTLFNAAQPRLALQLGIDCAMSFSNRMQLGFSFDYEKRSRYYDYIGEVKLKYLF